jgi:Domain of unknown function (DUF4136)
MQAIACKRGSAVQRLLARWFPTVRSMVGVVLTAVVAACTDATVPSVGDLDVVLAVRDDTVNFQAISTFAMPDTVLHLDELLGIGGPVLDRSHDAEILAQVALNFEQRGYQRELDPANHRPDLIVLVMATASTQVSAWVSYPWFSFWGFYPGWAFFPGFTTAWGVTYPWAPVASAFVWRQGTLLVDAIDTRRIDVQAKHINSVWAGAVNGVLQQDPSQPNRVVVGIDEMFVLSPYLHTNGVSP